MWITATFTRKIKDGVIKMAGWTGEIHMNEIVSGFGEILSFLLHLEEQSPPSPSFMNK